MVRIARKQTLVQLTDDLVAALDERAAREGVSRSALIRDAVEAYLHDDREAEISRQIVEAYTRMPETEEERRWAESASRAVFRQLDEEDGGW